MIEHYEHSTKRLKMLDKYCEMLKNDLAFSSFDFIWEEAVEHCRPETLDPAWRKAVGNRIKRMGLVYKENTDGFSIERSAKA